MQSEEKDPGTERKGLANIPPVEGKEGPTEGRGGGVGTERIIIQMRRHRSLYRRREN